jgi:hypothetical protein
MISSVKPVLTEDLHVVQKKGYSICAKYIFDEKPSIFIRDIHIFLSEKMLHKDYYCKSSVGKKKISGRGPQGVWLQDQLIGGKPPVIK